MRMSFLHGSFFYNVRPAAYISLAEKSWDWIDEHRNAGRGCLDDRPCIAGVIDPECC